MMEQQSFTEDFLEKVRKKDDIAYHVANVTAIPFKHLYSARISSLNISLLCRLLLLFGRPDQGRERVGQAPAALLFPLVLVAEAGLF